MSKLILTDCDGVLLNWEYAFDIWMQSHGYEKKIEGLYSVTKSYDISEEKKIFLIKNFNESASMGFLPPHRDAMFYVDLLHRKHGYVFDVITSMSLDPFAIRLREMNLFKLFGTAINKVVCLDTGADKDHELEKYSHSGVPWIEDKITNAEVGYDLGLSSVLMEHEHNMKYNNPNIPIVKNWQEIYEMLT